MQRNSTSLLGATQLLVVCIILSLYGSAHAAETIKISGTGTGIGTMKLLIAAFEKRNPGVAMKLMPNVGSGGAIKAVAEGALDIGLNGRPLNAEELKLGLLVTDYARTPFVFAVNRTVKTKNITSAELVRIYTGEMPAWPEGGQVRVVLRPASDADTLLARTISPVMNAAVDAALAREGMLMAPTNQECHDMLEHMPGSIGFSSLTQILTEKHPLKALRYNGVEPSVSNIANGRYPLVKSLSLVTTPDLSPATRRFIEFVRSAEGRRILERTGNLPAPGASGK